MTSSIFLECTRCGDKFDATTFKSPKQVKYCGKCKQQVRNEQAIQYYHNRKTKCVCGANNKKNKTRCWKCGINLKVINPFTKPKTFLRQLEVMT